MFSFLGLGEILGGFLMETRLARFFFLVASFFELVASFGVWYFVGWVVTNV